MPAVGISPHAVEVVLRVKVQQAADQASRWAAGLYFDRDRKLVSQSSKDLAYMTYHLQLPMGDHVREGEGESLLLAMIRNPVGTELMRCPHCGGTGETDVPDPNNWNSDVGGYRDKTVSCPSCSGHGWIPQKSS